MFYSVSVKKNETEILKRVFFNVYLDDNLIGH
jgi:hypothetical protein